MAQICPKPNSITVAKIEGFYIFKAAGGWTSKSIPLEDKNDQVIDKLLIVGFTVNNVNDPIKKGTLNIFSYVLKDKKIVTLKLASEKRQAILVKDHWTAHGDGKTYVCRGKVENCPFEIVD